jgi:hypothetical protein
MDSRKPMVYATEQPPLEVAAAGAGIARGTSPVGAPALEVGA